MSTHRTPHHDATRQRRVLERQRRARGVSAVDVTGCATRDRPAALSMRRDEQPSFDMEGTILAAVPAGVIEAAVALGVSRRDLLAASGLTEEVLADPDARVPVATDWRVWLALSQQPLGLALGDRLGIASIGVVGYAMQHDRTVGDALAWLQRFRAVLHPEFVAESEVRNTAAGPRLVFSKAMQGPFAALREPVFAYASATRGLLRALTGLPVQPRLVTYPLARPADPSPHERWFACPVAWGGTQFEMAFDADLLDRPLPRNDPHLFAYLAQQAERLLAAVPVSDSTSALVRREIATLLASGEPRQEQIARRLAMSTRTLQRRLHADGTSFAMLLDDVRRERAELLLRDAHLAASEVAFLLGYSEPAAFFRAFKRWTGVPPQAWRAQRR